MANLAEEVQKLLDNEDIERDTGRTTVMVREIFTHLDDPKNKEAVLIVHKLGPTSFVVDIIAKEAVNRKTRMIYHPSKRFLSFSFQSGCSGLLWLASNASESAKWPLGSKIFEDHYSLQGRLQRTLNLYKGIL